jgi:2-polyprenyl-6-methoxyphenol hydroxylase-like FAD-dependent oxidoreductase
VTRISIIGGGIGGLTAALTLRQFGFAPDVFEQAPELLEVGAAIAVWPNAMRVLERLGFAEQIMQHAGIIERVSWLEANGKLINSTSLPKSDTPAVALQRADLQSVLLHALPPGSIHLGKVCDNFQQKQDRVEVKFADGSTSSCDLLIGCDGLHSHVRARMLGDQAPVFRGYTVWRGTSMTAPRELDLNTAIELHGPGQRFGIGPVGLNRIGWWATANELQSNHECGAVTKQSLDQQSELLTLFAGWYAPVRELIASTPAAAIVRTAAFDRPATRTWGQGRMTLLGDAVHPTTPNLGQGGCLAIEDAAILARCLQKYGPEEQALRAYEKIRYPRTKAVSTCSRIYGGVGQWENPWATGLRRTALSLLPKAIARRLLRLIVNYDSYGVRI